VERLRAYQGGVCLELTNLITQPKLEDKIDQAIRAKRALESLVPDAQILAGIGFLNTSILIRPTDTKLNQLSFVQPMKYESHFLGRAFELVGEYFLSSNQRQLYDMVNTAHEQGAPLEWLLNPTQQNWVRLQQLQDVKIPNSRRKHVDLMRVLKGFVLEEYGRMVYAESLPDAYMQMRWEYARGEVDLVIAYHRKDVRRAISDMHVIWLRNRKEARRSKGYINAPNRR